MRDGVSESNRPLFSAPSIMLISIAARLMEEGGVSALRRSLSLSFVSSRWERDVLSALGRPCIMHSTCNYCRSIGFDLTAGVFVPGENAVGRDRVLIQRSIAQTQRFIFHVDEREFFFSSLSNASATFSNQRAKIPRIKKHSPRDRSILRCIERQIKVQR